MEKDLKNFLKGMETKDGRDRVPYPPPLKNFLKGMETS